MQPYFLPYIGYFQLIGAVDLFIVYDNIKYTKKGWINRNRLLVNGQAAVFSVPLKSDSDFLDIREREVAEDFDPGKLLSQFAGAYRNAPMFGPTYALLVRIMRYEERNLFAFIHHSLVQTCEHLGLQTPIRVSSEIAIDHGLKGQDKVLALCQAVGATGYVNAIGGLELYSKEAFRAHAVELSFIRARPFDYPQFKAPFVPWLSIVDVLMFNSLANIRKCIESNYDLF